jgi:hypothetical protein
MNYNNTGDATFIYRTECKIENDKVIPAYKGRDNHWSVYNPFDEAQPIYLKFAALKNDNDIIAFISQYGFIFCNWTDHTIGFTKFLNDELKYTYAGEDLNSIKREITKLRLLIKLKSLFDEYKDEVKQLVLKNDITATDKIKRVFEIQKIYKPVDRSKLKETISEIYKINGRTLKQDFPEKYSNPNIQHEVTLDPVVIAENLIPIEINRTLMKATPSLYYSMFNQRFEERLNCTNLLTAMYMQFYQMLISGRRLKQCANEKCLRYFEISSNDDKSKYCKDLKTSSGQSCCAHAQMQRQNRKNNKEKKAGVTNGDNSKAR